MSRAAKDSRILTKAPAPASCGNCFRWLREEGRENVGYCRRGPAQVIVTEMTVVPATKEEPEKLVATKWQSLFPPMMEYSCCGEHKPV